VTTALEAGLEVLPLLGLLLGCQDLARRRRKIGGGIRVGDMDVEDGGVTTAPEAVDTDITSVIGPVGKPSESSVASVPVFAALPT
jgi:hypothetical protein